MLIQHIFIFMMANINCMMRDSRIDQILNEWNKPNPIPYKISMDLSYTGKPSEGQTQKYDIKFTQLNYCRILEIYNRVGGKSNNDELYCINDKYGFVLSRKPNAKDWVLIDAFLNSKVDSNKLNDHIRKIHMYSQLPSLSLGPTSFKDFFPEHGTIESVTNNDDGITVVRFKGKGTDIAKINYGNIILRKNDPIGYQATKIEYAANNSETINYSIFIDYVKSGYGQSVPSIVASKFKSGEFSIDSVTKYTKLTTSGEIDESKFTIEHYGLTNPFKEVKQSNYMYLWFSFTGIVLLIVAIFILSRRNRQTTT